MEFIGNIDTNNFDLLDAASLNSGIPYVKGSYMVFILNSSREHDFSPFFCATRIQGVHLLKAYLELAKEVGSSKNFENDSFVITSAELSKI